MPTQAALMREFGASSLTVQKAIALLKQNGRAASRPGKGAFVAHRDHPDGADDLDEPQVASAAWVKRAIPRLGWGLGGGVAGSMLRGSGG
ncbi:GntR family transcriptional regulator [Streptomyces sp. NPDC048484]|uniref:GntR family transcriptional regulator n=1 Tax=Streptomyces sp. NPDC048484 TaxID=3155146 RepID=UPI00344AD29C